jgi:hypothetical protein
MAIAANSVESTEQHEVIAPPSVYLHIAQPSHHALL